LRTDGAKWTNMRSPVAVCKSRHTVVPARNRNGHRVHSFVTALLRCYGSVISNCTSNSIYHTEKYYPRSTAVLTPIHILHYVHTLLTMSGFISKPLIST